MKKIILITGLVLISFNLFSQYNKTNIHLGVLGEGLGPTFLLESDLYSDDKEQLYLRGGFSWLFFGYGIPHGVSFCKGDKNQIEVGVSGMFSSTEEFFGKRIAKEYHISPVLGYRTYIKSKKAFFRLYLNPMINSAEQTINYGLFNGKRAVFMAGLGIGFRLK